MGTVIENDNATTFSNPAVIVTDQTQRPIQISQAPQVDLSALVMPGVVKG